MRKSGVLVFVFLTVCHLAFAQTGVLRGYVGLISQSYHPGIVSYFEKIMADLDKEKKETAVKAIDLFLRGAAGSGFVISDDSGTNYIVTNYHVIAQAYTLSVTFEHQDGSKKRYDGLRIVAADEGADLALLTFAPGDKPVDKGLAFLTRTLEEGEDVYSAGFPGMGITTIWQFGRGMVSNAAVQFPRSLEDETLMGPFIQHTAQVDPGNSGGPLLVPQEDVPASYAVAGVNTLSALRRQAANYAIPVGTVQQFIDIALNPQTETRRAALDKQISEFTAGLGLNRAVYPHIAEFLSSACVGENAEYAISELLGKAPRTVQDGFIEKCEDSVVEAMGYAVAWTIENDMRGQGVIRAGLKEISGSGEDYTVVFTVNGKDISSRWVWEYGAWRIRTFGETAAGNKDLIAKKETEKKNNEALRTESAFTVEAGFGSLFGKSPAALYVAVNYLGFLGAQMYVAGPDYVSLGVLFGWRWKINMNNIGLMPNIYGGIDFINDKAYNEFKEAKEFKETSDTLPGFPIAITGQVGLKFTTSYVPGLFGGIGFQLNAYDLREKDYKDKMIGALLITVGYAF
jgi:serine protease Do